MPQMDNAALLLGKWNREFGRDATMYPEELEFREHTYRGRNLRDRLNVPYWDAGGYQVLEGNRIRISTANDAQIVYEFRIDGDLLTFSDPSGKTIQYRRE